MLDHEAGDWSADLSRWDLPVQQADTYERLRLKPDTPLPNSKVGVSRSALAGDLPIHGLRHRPSGDTNGWYAWAGEYSDAENLFVPVHVEDIAECLPAVAAYLGLPPGWRFLVAPGYEDVWSDPSLLDG